MSVSEIAKVIMNFYEQDLCEELNVSFKEFTLCLCKKGDYKSILVGGLNNHSLLDKIGGDGDINEDNVKSILMLLIDESNKKVQTNNFIKEFSEQYIKAYKNL